MIKCENVWLVDELCLPKNKDPFACEKGLLGGITDAIGLTDYGGQADAAAASAAASTYATDASVALARENIKFQTEQLNFTKDQYNDWKNVFGDMSENLGEYYKNLTGTSYANRQVTAINKEMQNAKIQTQKELARSGLSSSGTAAAALTGLNVQGALSRAGIRAGAEDYVRAQQSGFLGLGLNQGTAYLGITAQQAGNVGNAYNTASNNQLQGGIATANNYQSYANQLAQGNAQMMQQMTKGALGGIGGSMSGSGFGTGLMAAMSSDFRLKNDIKYIKTINGIKLYTWEWNSEAVRLGLDTYEPYGVIAQEIMHIIPDAVSIRNGYYIVDYNMVNELLEDNDGE